MHLVSTEPVGEHHVMSEPGEVPARVPRQMWQWIGDVLGKGRARHFDPLVSCVLASGEVMRDGGAAQTSLEVLQHWARYLDSSRRLVHQNELQFIRHLRAAGRSDPEIRSLAVLDPDTDIDARLTELEQLVRRVDRPPPPQRQA
ncbi:hypothetical protein Ae717Ps2_6251 [Pseudonocardia sp. Ae717_Ps2]|nr:hypothetical protein Ae717Ps2_6251 [Pseudonocardia sp. Ae717_Ps2]